MLLCMSIIMFTQTIKSDEFFTVARGNVIHKFAKVHVDWIDNFLQYNFNSWENDTFEVFEKVKDFHGIAIDIGAWIGTTTIWLSKNFAYVVAVEADADSVKYLEKNTDASHCDNVIICNKAVSDREKLVTFGPRPSMGHSDALNGSTSFIKNNSDSQSDYTVKALSFQNIIEEYVIKNEKARNYPISFIKCDIEGGEEVILKDILEYALAHNCKVWMSFHIPWWSEGKALTDFAGLFKKFKTNISVDVCEYINENPFGSILFEPLS